jgi:hypothetical protein
MLLLAPVAAGGLITLLIYVLIFLTIAGLLFWAINKLSAAFGIPEPIKTVLIVILVVVVVVGLLYALMGAIPRGL